MLAKFGWPFALHSLLSLSHLTNASLSHSLFSSQQSVADFFDRHTERNKQNFCDQLFQVFRFLAISSESIQLIFIEEEV